MTSFDTFSQRSRFESGGGGGTNTPISRNLETNNQTLPRTFRWNNTSNHSTSTPTPTLIGQSLIGAAGATGSQSQLPTSEKSTINRFLSGSGTNTPISTSRNLVEINSSPMPWKSSSTNFCDSPYQQRRRLDNSVESAAKFLTEALPCTNNTGSCKNALLLAQNCQSVLNIKHSRH